MMYDELVKKLRNYASFTAIPPLSVDLSEAAGAIEGLNNLCMDLQGELKRTRSDYKQGKELQEELKAGLVEMIERIPRWIPVTERLPEPNAVDEYGFAKGYLVKTDRHVMMHTARYTGEWWIFWGKAEVITDTVTHWMPLPEPPKEETE